MTTVAEYQMQVAMWCSMGVIPSHEMEPDSGVRSVVWHRIAWEFLRVPPGPDLEPDQWVRKAAWARHGRDGAAPPAPSHRAEPSIWVRRAAWLAQREVTEMPTREHEPDYFVRSGLAERLGLTRASACGKYTIFIEGDTLSYGCEDGTWEWWHDNLEGLIEDHEEDEDCANEIRDLLDEMEVSNV